MDQVYLFGLASQRTAWLANRQSVVAENVANVNTPGYTSKEITPFEEVLENTRLSQMVSNPMHQAASTGRSGPGSEAVEGQSWDVKHSGNSVTVEQEMLKAGEVSRDYALNTSVVKSFHRMLLMSVKG